MSKPVLVISPHLDDAILGAGQFVAGRGDNVDILTVFSGIPNDPKVLTDYDRKSGFTTSRDAMVVRRQEDLEACAILNATAYHTDILDSQYSGGRQTGISQVIKEAIEAKEYEFVLAPVGLIHPDHEAVSNAAYSLGIDNLVLYEDLPARVTHPETVVKRGYEFNRDIGQGEPDFIGDGPIDLKIRALWAYRSQIGKGDLNPYNLYVSERFWKV